MNFDGAVSPEVLVTNFQRRFTGVSATADAVLSRQSDEYEVRLVGRPLPLNPEALTFREAVFRSRRPPIDRPFVIWHVRRNIEMAAAISVRDVLCYPAKVIFTSAAQRRHSRVPRALIRRMDAVVATTPLAATFVPHVAAVIPHGVDTQRFTPATDRAEAWRQLGLPGKYGIGIVGRIRPEKGTDRFVDALCNVLPERPDFTGVIIGRALKKDAAFELSLRKQIAGNGLQDRIFFLGEQPHDRIPSIVRGLSLLVAAARYEGYGMTPLEAMASGVAVVATDTGVYRSIIDCGRTGYVVGVDDHGGLREAIRTITRDVGNLHAMGRTARVTAVTRLSLEQEIRGYREIYERLWRGETFKSCRAQRVG
jgi:mannosyltransferase